MAPSLDVRLNILEWIWLQLSKIQTCQCCNQFQRVNSALESPIVVGHLMHGSEQRQW